MSRPESARIVEESGWESEEEGVSSKGTVERDDEREGSGSTGRKEGNLEMVIPLRMEEVIKKEGLKMRFPGRSPTSQSAVVLIALHRIRALNHFYASLLDLSHKNLTQCVFGSFHPYANQFIRRYLWKRTAENARYILAHMLKWEGCPEYLRSAYWEEMHFKTNGYDRSVEAERNVYPRGMSKEEGTEV
ncbi:hypothetical protein HK097_007947 [Rhizophlyctis rosea]|uniref:Uncharacterized protein n=1 Tax=Rhizophlyctis rosea TaxID=64517 RepID=A0AAD5SCY4_9FUNG|nr:hypothetical protein HK097_007947 [Rhizophlyctis rosea]